VRELVDVGLLVRNDALAHKTLDEIDVAAGKLGMLEVHVILV
jgi:hypothetical protein